MSRRNLFIINSPVSLKSVANTLVIFALDRGFGIHFNPSGYQEDILKLLGVKEGYFSVSDNFASKEIDDLFEIHEYDERNFKEVFHKKFNFLNNIVSILFSQPEITSVDFYLAECVVGILEDYKIVKVKGHDLVSAFHDEVVLQVKQQNYLDIVTAKFEIIR